MICLAKKVILTKYDFEKDIKCNAKIIKTHENYYVAKYVNLNPHDEDKIVKYVFKMIAKK